MLHKNRDLAMPPGKAQAEENVCAQTHQVHHTTGAAMSRVLGAWCVPNLASHLHVTYWNCVHACKMEQWHKCAALDSWVDQQYCCLLDVRLPSWTLHQSMSKTRLIHILPASNTMPKHDPHVGCKIWISAGARTNTALHQGSNTASTLCSAALPSAPATSTLSESSVPLSLSSLCRSALRAERSSRAAA